MSKIIYNIKPFGTIEELTLSTFDFVVGDIIDLQGYYTAGDGAHHKRKIESADDGSGVQLANGLWANIVHSGEVNVSWFGAKGDGVTDDAVSIRRTIKAMYNSVEQVGWRRGTKIKFDGKTYKVSGSIIDSNLGITAGRFFFEGNGRESTVIDFTGALIDNTQLFGFVQFDKMSFTSDDAGIFMNMGGGGSGNAQAFNFNNCAWSKMATVIKTSGGTMCSEVTFNQCKISNFDENSKIFIINNPQGVNWRFFGTDIEVFKGACFELLSGFACAVWQGSIIPIGNAKVVSVPNEADSSMFGPNNSPDLTFYSSRFELRGNSKLISKLQIRTNLGVLFYACGMGGYNQPSLDDAEHKTIEIVGGGTYRFENCYNLQKFRMSSKQTVSEGYSPTVEFLNCDINAGNVKNFLNNSTNENAGSNSVWYPHIIVDGVVFNGNVRFTKKSFRPLTLTNEIRINNGSNVVNEVFNIDLCGSSLFSLQVSKIKISNYGKSGYGNPTYTFNLYNSDKTKVLATGTIRFESKESLEFFVAENVTGFILEVSTTSTYNNIQQIPITIEVM